jgi:FAD/FMN-containing dehydrogenase
LNRGESSAEAFVFEGDGALRMTDFPSRRDVLAGAAATIALTPPAQADLRIVMNDASRLNPTPTARHWRAKSDPADKLIAALRDELKAAGAAGRPVVVGAARHSMGGQSLARDGLAISFDCGRIEPDTAAGTYRVDAGARWWDVIRALDPLGYGPTVMQSNADFGVGSTFSVNSHGWPAPHGPFGSTVRSIRIMTADGEVLECSRTQNPELFSLAMGGYGLFGVVIDLEVEMTKNVLLARQLDVFPAEEFGTRFLRAIDDDKTIVMAYGRLSVARNSFFRDALLATYRQEAHQPSTLPFATNLSALTGVSREIYRAQIGSEAAKRARWMAETILDPKFVNGRATRNSLMNEPVANLANSDARRTDILHEYFLPPQRFTEFIDACRRIIPPAQAEFLNVTLRYVAEDRQSVLAYAPERRIAAVMSFSQEISPEGEVDMLETTERLIDAALATGGAFYLPYRLHARRDQFATAYPKADHFAARKKYYDPRTLFRHAMWDAYFA